MRSLLTTVLCILMMLSSGTGNAEPSAIKLGALYNLSGDMKTIDAPAARGSRLAAKQVNENGGLLQGRKLELIVMDTRTDIKEAGIAAKKLISMGVVAGLGYCDTDPVLASAPVFEKHGRPFLTVGATDPDLPKKIGPFMFMTPFGDDDQAYAMADFAYTTLKAKNVVVWSNESNKFTKILHEFFKKRYLALGGKILSEEFFTSGRKDFSGLIQNLTKLSPPPAALFISGIPADAAPTVEQLRQAGIKLPILSGDGFDADLIKRVARPADADDVYFATHAYRGSKRPVAVAFMKAYEHEYGRAPENAFAALGYDAVNLLAQAIERAKSSDPKAIAEALTKTKQFEGVTGEITFSRSSRVPIAPVAIVGIKNGKYQLMTTWTP